ncbi:MAG: 8-amino-7-oxononanoate synthase [Nitrospirae bacterium]|nr:8-amino-7-oxononanoate synthase [Nitrospirota bacterium]
MEENFREENRRLRESGLFRELRRIDSTQGPRVTLRGKSYILLAPNNYLGLANHPQVVEAAREAAQNFGVGAGASRLVSGHMAVHERLEEAVAWLSGTETALLFNSGYAANLGLLPALAGRGDILYMDRLCHASLLDGALLSRARLVRYRHRDPEHLETLLAQGGAPKRRMIVTEGVFSMDGDIAPLPRLSELASRYGALLYVDDAHALGVLGKTGGGTAEHFGLQGRIPVLMGTLGKALGGFGAFIACGTELKQYLINTARTLIYSTALPPPVAAAAFAAVKVLRESPHLRESLWNNRNYFWRGLRDMGFQTLESETPIIPVLIGDHRKTVRFSEILMEAGIFAPAIRPPTVPWGTSRIRTTVTASHTTKDLDDCLAAFRKAGETLGIV